VKAEASWEAVMAGLTGCRMALYDDALRLGAVEVTGGTHRGPEWEAAADWLRTHRLLDMNPLDGTYRPVTRAAAQADFEKRGGWSGPAPRPAVSTPPAGVASVAVAPPRQEHQAQFFDLEGYRA
jgi:hypothetical protein